MVLGMWVCLPKRWVDLLATSLYEASANNSQEKGILQAPKNYLFNTASTHTDELWNLQPIYAPNIQA